MGMQFRLMFAIRCFFGSHRHLRALPMSSTSPKHISPKSAVGSVVPAASAAGTHGSSGSSAATSPVHIGFDESEAVEFKRSWQEDCLNELCAFANTVGGALYVGVEKDGTITGCDVSDEGQLRISGKIRHVLQINPQISVYRVAGAPPCLEISVRHQSAPVYVREGYYRRVGTETVRVVDRNELTSLLLEQLGQNWESGLADATLDDIDEQRVRNFVRHALTADSRGRDVRVSRAIDPDTHSVTHIIKSLGDAPLLVDGKPTRAALLLFGRNPQLLVTGARIKVLGVDDVNTITPFADIIGTVPEQIDAALRLVVQLHPPRAVFDSTASEGGDVAERTRHTSRPQIAELALKEAIANAVVHRDYIRGGTEVTIKIMPDRIVITNPGGLAGGLQLADLRMNPHPSERRNPMIAGVCFLDHIVERYGYGTLRMIEECVSHGLPEPEFSMVGNNFTVTFLKSPVSAGHPAVPEFSPRERFVIDVLRKDGPQTRAALQSAAVTRMPALTGRFPMQEVLRALEKRGILRREGPKRGPGVKYALTDT